MNWFLVVQVQRFGVSNNHFLRKITTTSVTPSKSSMHKKSIGELKRSFTIVSLSIHQLPLFLVSSSITLMGIGLCLVYYIYVLGHQSSSPGLAIAFLPPDPNITLAKTSDGRHP